jgi:hypothetical protein
MHPHHMAVLTEPLEEPEHMTCAAIHYVINNIIECMMPCNAPSRVKPYLQRQFIRPADTSVRSYYQRLAFINTQEMPLIPPHGINQAFDNNAIKDVFCSRTRLNGSAKWTEWDSIPITTTPWLCFSS